MTNCVSTPDPRSTAKHEMRAAPTQPIARDLRPSRSRARFLPTLVLSCVFAVASCHSATGSKCDSFTVYTYRIAVTAKDSVTGVLVPHATVIATGQSDTSKVSIGSDVTQYPADLSVLPGAYAVSVAAPGYAIWTTAINVANVCTQPQVAVAAQMQKSP
jgi:hypothetical protein